MERLLALYHWLLDSSRGASNHLLSRWLFLRALGLIYISAFFPLLFQIRGLIGQHGILPANEYLQLVASSLPHGKFFFAPTLLWISTGPHMLTGICWVGVLAGLLLAFNLWPRAMLLVCFVCFLSFVSAAEDFSGYQSDGMLLEAGFISLFFVPSGLRPGWGADSPPSRASLFLLLYEWFRIYFESGVAKIVSGDPHWRNFTAMDEYYQNGPLPTWIGWYVQQLPHRFHSFTSFLTLFVELALVWMLFLGRRARIVSFFIVTALQIGIILTANYTFLNYIVLALGFLLLDDRFFRRWLPPSLQTSLRCPAAEQPAPPAAAPAENPASPAPAATVREEFFPLLKRLRLTSSLVIFLAIFYSATTQMLWMLWPALPLPARPVEFLDPFRIANRYGLFAVMTPARYEIEFQGSDDAKNWLPYPFLFKPQDPAVAPSLYAPYQPRFDWNLWFASLGNWRQYPIVISTEERLLRGDPDVLGLFAADPFAGHPPRYLRAVLWRYWFTSLEEKRSTGMWWRRQLLGLYAPPLVREPDGSVAIVRTREQ